MPNYKPVITKAMDKEEIPDELMELIYDKIDDYMEQDPDIEDYDSICVFQLSSNKYGVHFRALVDDTDYYELFRDEYDEYTNDEWDLLDKEYYETYKITVYWTPSN